VVYSAFETTANGIWNSINRGVCVYWLALQHTHTNAKDSGNGRTLNNGTWSTMSSLKLWSHTRRGEHHMVLGARGGTMRLRVALEYATISSSRSCQDGVLCVMSE